MLDSMNCNNTAKEVWHKKRLCAEERFKWYGRLALFVSVLMLVLLIGNLTVRGWGGFIQTQIKLSVAFDAEKIGVTEDRSFMDIPPSRYMSLMRDAIKSRFPDITQRNELRLLYDLAGGNSAVSIKNKLINEPELLGKTIDVWIPASSNADLFFKGKIKEKTSEEIRALSDLQITWLKEMENSGEIRKVFNSGFFTDGDSRNPESAGFFGAVVGSALTLVICFAMVFPLGVATAVFLEEFSRKNRFVDLIEVNINNLAAVPSIVFGLLGLALYINVMGMPRSAPLVGGMTLALMILPVIIIVTRTSLKSIPNSIRDAARALGATQVQVVWHHTLPLAMPGIMTGSILGMARAIGETAPLLMIGMVAFVADVPKAFTDSATVMPVQIYLWASSPEVGFVEKTAAGILVLLVLLIMMNMLAIILRKKFEIRW